MKKINGKKYKCTDKIETNKLYTAHGDIVIPFVEKQSDGTFDKVDVNYNISSGQYGIFGSEYRPSFLERQDCKAVDILGIVVDDSKKRFSSYIFDVKASVGGEDVIFHLVEQLIDSISHKRVLCSYFNEYEEREYIGVITREIDEPRIQKSIQIKENILKERCVGIEKVSVLMRAKMEMQLIRIEKEVHILKLFQGKKLQYEDMIYDIHIHCEEQDQYEKEKYFYQLCVCI